jgi:A/G-specific adenine glycosylase
LEQRPAKGIWGGLWCLPTIAAEDCPIVFLDQHYATTITNVETLCILKHTFTHFQLNIQVKAIKIDENLEFPGRWVTAKQLIIMALPKPIKTITDYFVSIHDQS